MQLFVGESIRQLRRQQSLTQTELGGDHFSKSYVSAVERGKISPSQEALRFFAQQLGQANDYLTTMMQETESQRSLSPFHTTQIDIPQEQNEFIELLDVLLADVENYSTLNMQEFPSLSPRVVDLLSKERQAHYAFLLGRVAQEKSDLPTALRAFEQALSLATPAFQPMILDEIGVNYYLNASYQIALDYHKRAFQLLQEQTVDNSSTLLLRIELHCGNAYRALGAYRQARTHYEKARQYLTALHDMKTASQLYMGLGYCTYACIHQNTTLLSSVATSITPEEVEREFQHALSYLVQSRTLCQVSGDRATETAVRLLQAMILLDFSTKRRQFSQKKSQTSDLPFTANCSSLLDEIEEQCHQVLMYWKEPLATENELPADIVAALYAALSYQVRLLTQRATLARLSGYHDTAERERSLATHLCQQVLDTFSDQSFPWQLLHEVIHLQVSSLTYHPQSLPRLPITAHKGAVIQSINSQIEVSIAAAEICEELGRAATNYDFIRDCYIHADQYFQKALKLMHSNTTDIAHDAGELMRHYQRYIDILEERLQASPELAEETNKTLLEILKEGLISLQRPAFI